MLARAKMAITAPLQRAAIRGARAMSGRTLQSSIDETFETRRGVAAADAWATSIPSPTSAGYNSSIDETWETRRGVAAADTWASSIPSPASAGYNSSIDETWETRRNLTAADAWTAGIQKRT